MWRKPNNPTELLVRCPSSLLLACCVVVAVFSTYVCRQAGENIPSVALAFVGCSFTIFFRRGVGGCACVFIIMPPRIEAWETYRESRSARPERDKTMDGTSSTTTSRPVALHRNCI